MSLLRRIMRGIRALTNRAATDREIADEVEHYLSEATEGWRAEGLSDEEAERAARLELGNAPAVREQIRGYGWENIVETFVGDVRYAGRRLVRNPTFAAVAILTLATGIGASTAIFSAVKPILFEPLPYPDADRLVMIWDTGQDGARADVTFGTFRELAARSRSFSAMAVMRTWQPTLTGATTPERLDGQRVSADYFAVLGVLPAVGRAFDAADDRPGAPLVAVISAALWKRRFEADPTVVGRPILLDDSEYTVIGVMPPAFENLLAPSADVWTPLRYDPSLPLDGREWGHHLRLAARVVPHLPLENAGRELAIIAATPIRDFARPMWASLQNGLQSVSLQDEVTHTIRPALIAVQGAVLLLLVIACVNVTNLFLARGVDRRPEFALRAALGASRLRLLRQMMAESLLVAALGGVFGVAVAQAAVRAFVAVAPADLPRVHAIQVDTAALMFAIALTTTIGLIVAAVPSRQAADVHAASSLQTGSPRIVGGHHATRRVLVVVQVALAFVLLAGAGLLLRSLQRLLSVPTGFDPAHVLTMQVQASGREYADRQVANRFFSQALDAVRGVPGATVAGFSSQLPLTDDRDAYGIYFESSPARAGEDGSAFRYAVSPGYVEAMGIALTRGRLFDTSDIDGRPRVALVNESLVRARFPGRDPIGQRLRLGGDDQPWFTIVGVVADVKQTSLAVAASNAVYVTSEQWRFADRARWLVVKVGAAGAGQPDVSIGGVVDSIRQAIWSIDKDQPIVRVAMMTERVAASAAERRFALLLLEAFGGAALLLAGIGIYGVIAGAVSERRREIGVRAALGASPRVIVSMVLRQGLVLAVYGIVLGIVSAMVLSGLLVALLFGVSRVDVPTYISVILLLSGVAAMACGVPAWRAVGVPPSIALTNE
jgi:putative ABC transport system permease protein